MLKDELSFDNFLTYDLKTQNLILNDFELIKIMLSKNISEKRLLHSEGTAQTCKLLARYHHYDENKAYLAGLLHDCCKFEKTAENLKKLEAYLLKYEPNKLNGIVGAYHSWAAYYYLKEKLNFKDEEILKAIYNHTILESEDTLSLILYIADKREPNRNIKDDILKVAQSDLKLAFKLLQEDVKKYLESQNERFVTNSL